jgi:phospholipid transport system transporter-binding protein
MATAKPATGMEAAAADVFRLVAHSDGILTACGPLTFAGARTARQLGLRALAGATRQDLQIDCAGVTLADSAGLAVLLDWLAAAKRSGRSLRFAHLPEGLLALGRISEVEQLLTRGV